MQTIAVLHGLLKMTKQLNQTNNTINNRGMKMKRVDAKKQVNRIIDHRKPQGINKKDINTFVVDVIYNRTEEKLATMRAFVDEMHTRIAYADYIKLIDMIDEFYD